MIDNAHRHTTGIPCDAAGDGKERVTEHDEVLSEEDFDALLQASSFGSPQARAIRAQAPDASRAHAQRVVDGEEQWAPPDRDEDDAVGDLVEGIAQGLVPASACLQSTELFRLHLRALWMRAGGHGDLSPVNMLLPSAADRRVFLLDMCSAQSQLLWPDHRASLLQALVDHDAVEELRPDVATRIVDCVSELRRPPRVLLQIAELAARQTVRSEALCVLASALEPVRGREKDESATSLALPWSHRQSRPENPAKARATEQPRRWRRVLAHDSPAIEMSCATAASFPKLDAPRSNTAWRYRALDIASRITRRRRWCIVTLTALLALFAFATIALRASGLRSILMLALSASGLAITIGAFMCSWARQE